MATGSLEKFPPVSLRREGGRERSTYLHKNANTGHLPEHTRRSLSRVLRRVLQTELEKQSVVGFTAIAVGFHR